MRQAYKKRQRTFGKRLAIELYNDRFSLYICAFLCVCISMYNIYENHGMNMRAVYGFFFAFVLVRIPHVFGLREDDQYDKF